MSAQPWRGDSDHSDDDLKTNRKRSSRACDQCRKTKSKCERSPPEAELCKNCAASGNVCTFLGPSYKRGPPKGYIHAIEQRWQTIESLLGAIIACPAPAVQNLLAGLRQDDLARDILNRVDAGPFGPSGRAAGFGSGEAGGGDKEDLLAQIFKSNESASASSRDAARLRRQSRISREVVSSSQDTIPMQVPTSEWQDRISSLLGQCSSSSVGSSRSGAGLDAGKRRRTGDASVFGAYQDPDPQRQPEWGNMYTMPVGGQSDEEECADDVAEGVGLLSLDENSEIRYHGKQSGLALLARSSRKDGRNEGGIWRLPMSRVWPGVVPAAPCTVTPCTMSWQEEEAAGAVKVDLPDVAEQERLLSLYFTYVHPVFPVVHKKHFFSEFSARKNSPLNGNSPRDDAWAASPASTSTGTSTSQVASPNSPRPPPANSPVPRVLLLAMLALGARFTTKNVEPPPARGELWQGGQRYFDDARAILNTIIHESRPSTCQALLLLGHREFGLGSMEQGWLYFGLAIRMAFDLGLNRNSDKWSYRGTDLFSPVEKQMRKQIWYGCVLVDEYSAVYMGRPVYIHENDFDTPLPDAYPAEEAEGWQATTCDPMQMLEPVPARVMSCFRASATLSGIVGAIVTRIYSVKRAGRSERMQALGELESRLDQFYVGLPDALRCDTMTGRVVPPPHILYLHMKYWAVVLLLHRAFLPNWKLNASQSPASDSQTTSLKSFDLCQTAASHVSALATVYHENFNLSRSSPFLGAILLNVGVTHTVTLTLRPSNRQASLGLRQCLTALKQMEMIWPSAGRAWALLEGVSIQLDNALPVDSPGSDRRNSKRHADDAFGQEKSSDYLSRAAFEQPAEALGEAPGVQDVNTRIMAHMLGLDVPGIQPSTSYYPGYEWWPSRADGREQQQQQQQQQQEQQPVPASPECQLNFDSPASLEEWLRAASMAGKSAPNYGFDFTGMQTY